MRDIRSTGAKPPKTKPPRPHHVRALKIADAKVKRERNAARGATAVGAVVGKKAPKVPAPLGGEVYTPQQRRADLRQLGRRVKQIQAGGHEFSVGHIAHNLDSALGAVGLSPTEALHNVKELIPGTREQQQAHRKAQAGLRRFQKTGEIPKPTIGIVPGVFRGPKVLRAELKAHPVRQAFHSNIDKTVADKKLAAKMKQTFDRETLKRAKKSGVSPGQYLDKQKGPAAAPKVTAGLSAGRAQTLRRQQEGLYHAERSRRAGAAAEAMKQTPGSAGFKAAKQELRGSLPKIEFQGLKNLSDEEINKLDAHVATHPELLPYEKIHVHDALHNARDLGTLPTNYDRGLLRKAFGPEYEKQLFTPSRLQKAKHAAIETANIPRAVMSSADISAPGRQGIVAISRHPVITGRNLKPMLKSFGSEKYYQGRRVAVEANPYYKEAQSHGLAVTDMEHSLANREESFQSNYAEHIPAVGHVVRSSGRAYTDFLVNSRMDIYAHLRQLADKQGVELDRKALKDLTGYINSATGRGGLGQFERSAVGLNSVFFSPRLVASRLDFLLPWRYAGLDPFVRKQKLRAAAQFVGMLTTALYLADQVPGVVVGIDPRSTDFGKIKIGDTTLDLTGGFSQYARLMAQMATNQKINPATGKPEKGKSWDTLARFVRGKFSPTTSAGVDIGTHTQYSGQPLDWKSEAASHGIPLGLQDAYSIYHNTGSIPGAAAGYGASAVGIGVQNYKPTAKIAPKVPLEEALRQEVRKYFHKDLPPQIKQALKLRERRTKYLDDARKKAKSDGKPFTSVDRYNAQVDLLRELGKISPSQARQARRWAASQKGAVGTHKVGNRADSIADKYFGGSILTSAGKKLRARGSQFYLSDH